MRPAWVSLFVAMATFVGSFFVSGAGITLWFCCGVGSSGSSSSSFSSSEMCSAKKVLSNGVLNSSSVYFQPSFVQSNLVR